jgi:hypothetical protein
MNQLIDRYVHDVTRRLPESERAEVGKELKANIYDMLSDNPDEDEIKSVLYGLGAPDKLAEKYRQKPRYLISPAYFDEYIRVLKLVVPLVGIVVMAIGMILGAVDAVKADTAGFVEPSIGILTEGISMGISAAFQALVWTTIGFVIADHAGAKEASKKPEWSVDDLPELPVNDDKNKIPLSDSITELVVTLVFTILGILLCLRLVPYAMYFSNGDVQVLHIFTDSFLRSCIPAIAAMGVLGVAACIIKIRTRKWTPLTGIATIVQSVAHLAIMLYLINRNNIFTAEFKAFFQGLDITALNWLQAVSTNGTPRLLTIFTVVLIVTTTIECIKILYKTLRSK